MTFALTAGVITCLITIIWGSPVIALLKHYRLGKQIRMRGGVASRHLLKEGTPTFGGVMIIAPVLVATLLLNAANVLKGTPQGRSILLPLLVMGLYGALGAIDDWEGIRGLRAKGEGISAKVKIAGQLVIALAISCALYFLLDIHSVAIPLQPDKIDLGYWYIPIAMFILTATSNGANFTDGLDGLAGNVSATAFIAYGIISFLQGQIWLTIFDFVMVGALFGFLWFNAHPAQVFMGDTGSQAIGAALGVVALMSGQWLLLPIIAFIFLIEVLSVILQKLSFWYSEKYLGETIRIFKMSPIHHHFELSGWSEFQIVSRFWFVSILTAMLGIGLALL